MKHALLLLALSVATLSAQAPPAQPVPASASPGVELTAFGRIDQLVNDAIAVGQTPGAVVLVGHGSQVVYEKAYGQRAVVPAREPMTLDTVFDLASLTKVVATTTAVMSLVEQGRLRLNDPVALHVPGFNRHGKGAITINNATPHRSVMIVSFGLEVRGL